jgi:hypothetical protein
MNHYSKLSLLAAAIAAAGTVAYAAQGGMENDAMAITKAKIPLAQAVTTAEQHANGKASRAEYENSKQVGCTTWKSLAGPRSSMSRSMPTRVRSSRPPKTKRIAMTTKTSKTDCMPQGRVARVG